MLSALTLSVLAQKESADLRVGNKLYKAEKFTEAEVAYRKGLIKQPTSFEASYNLGNALFKQKKYPEALEQYKNALSLNPKEKAKIAAGFHNTGNAFLADNKIQESINAYKLALKNNPKDDETRYNLAYAQAMLKKQQNQDDDDKDQDKDEQQQQPQKKEQPQPPQQQKQQMSKENAQQILDALQQDEKNAQEKAKRQEVRTSKKAEKDW